MSNNDEQVGGVSAVDEGAIAFVGNGVRAILKAFGLNDERVAVVLDHLSPAQLVAVKYAAKVSPGVVAYAFAKLPKSIFTGFKNPEMIAKAVGRALEEFTEKIEEMIKNYDSVEKAPKAVREAAVVTSISAGLGLKGMSLKSDGVCFHRPTCLIVTTVLKTENRPPRKGKDGVEIPGFNNSKVFDIDLESAQEQGQKPCSACLAVLLFDAKAASVEKPKEEMNSVVPEKKPVSMAELMLEFFKKEPENRNRWHTALKALSEDEYDEVKKHLPYIDTADELELLLPALEARGRDLEFALRTMRDFNQKVRIGLEAAELAQKGQDAVEKLDAKVVGPLVDWLDGRPAKRVAPYAGGWAICGIIVLLLGLLSAGWAVGYEEMLLALVSLSIGVFGGAICGAVHHFKGKSLVSNRVSDNGQSSYEWRLLELPFAVAGKAYRSAMSVIRRSTWIIAIVFGLPLGLTLWFSQIIWIAGVRWTAFGAGVLILFSSIVILKDLAELMVIGKAGVALIGDAKLVTVAQFTEIKSWVFSLGAWYVVVYWFVFHHPYIDPLVVGGLALASAFFAFVRLTPWFMHAYFRPVIYGLALVVVAFLVVEIAFPSAAARAAIVVHDYTGIELAPKDINQFVLARRLIKEQSALRELAVEQKDGEYLTPAQQERDAAITNKLKELSTSGNDYWNKRNGTTVNKTAEPAAQTVSPRTLSKDEADDILRELEAAKALK